MKKRIKNVPVRQREKWAQRFFSLSVIPMMFLLQIGMSNKINAQHLSREVLEQADPVVMETMDYGPKYYIDIEVKELNHIAHWSNENDDVYHIFSHGREGELLIDGEWKGQYELIEWFAQILPLKTKHLNIYGCNFAKGRKGIQAISNIERALGISIAASDDITGIDGDWDLEVGENESSIQISSYESNLQYCPDVKYDVYVYYRATPTFTNNAVYRVISKSPTFDVTVNQRNHASATYTTTDDSLQTINWTPIATNMQFDISGTMRVRLLEDLSTTASGNWVIADAVLFVDEYGKEYLIDNSSATLTGSWLFQDNRNGAYNKNERNIPTGTAGNNFVTWTLNESATSQPDADGDGVPNVCDLDTDNDGITNVNECDSNSVTNGDFTGAAALTGWTTTNHWFHRGNVDAYVNNDAADTSDLSQTITVLTSSAMLHYDLLGNNAAARTADIEVYVNGVLVDKQSVDDIVTNAVSGSYHRQIPLNVASGDTAAILFRAIINAGTGSAQDVGVDNIFVGACDDDGDDIPNYLEIDSDGDGCNDAVEAGHIDADNDGDVDGASTDTDGKVTGATTAYTGNTAAVRDFSINSACCDVSKSGHLDSDGDGIANFCDLDNDNDGITNVNECDSNSVTNGDFTGAAALTGWTTTNHWFHRGNVDAFVNDDAADTSDLSQTITVATSSAMLHYDLLGNNAAARTADIEVYVNGVLVDKQSVDDIVTNAVGGSYHRQIPLNVASGDTAAILFRAIINAGTGAAQDVGVDNIFVGACDDDGDDIPNYLEIDSDGDGCSDAVEAGHIDADNDGEVDGTGVDADGKVTGASTAYTGNTAAVIDFSINSACCDVSKSGHLDSDGDGIANFCDLDNDNDGITNVNECDSNNVSNGDFTGAAALTGWTTSNHWFHRGNVDAFVNNSSADTSDLSQTITVTTHSALLTYDLKSQPAGIRDAFIEVYVNGALVDRQSGDAINESLHREIPLNVASGGTATILFRAIVMPGSVSVSADGVGVDNVFVGACDDDGDDIPNYLDRDSDGDGCPDALESLGNFYEYSDLAADSSLVGAVDTLGIPNGLNYYVGSAQDSTIQSKVCACESTSSAFIDSDLDGIGDLCDLDDDNDGILDINECDSNSVSNGDFTGAAALTGWTTTNHWIHRANIDAFVNNIAADTSDLSQTITVTTASAMLSYDLKSQSVGIRDAFIEVYVNNVLVDRQSANVISGNLHRQIPLNVASGATATILFRAIVTDGLGSSDGVGVDNVFVGACDDDGDDIPNYLEIDSDGDGCTDAVEAGHIDLNQDGIVDGTGTDSDGKVTGASTAYTGNTAGVRDFSINSACCDVSKSGYPDVDGDGIANFCDLDNDNDGITNVNECDSNSVTNGDFTGAAALTGWTTSNHWFHRGNVDAFVNDDAADTSDLSQTITVATSSAMLHYDLVGNVGFPREAFIEIYVNSVLVDKQSVDDIVTNAVSGSYHRQIPLNVASGATATILFRAIVIDGTGAAQDVGVDNVFVGACDDDDDDIPNYLEIDSDGDGCTDAVEAGHIDLNQDGIVDGTGTDSDGKVTGASTAYTGNTAGVRDFSINSACCDVSKSGYPDVDGDGIANFCDLDNDNDGITNVNECDSNSVTNGDFTGAAALTGWTTSNHWFHRGNVDAFVNDDAADTSDLSQTITVATSSAMLHYDLVGNGGFPREAFIEIYVNSVLVDRQSAVNIVANAVSGSYHRQIPLNVASGATATILFRAIVIDGTGNADDVGVDNIFVGGCDDDNDDIPNYLEIDSDGDGCTDAVEAGHIDLNQDGAVDGTGIDTDGKVTGATTAYTGNTAGVRDFSINSACCDVSKSGHLDSDGDGIANFCDLDNDNDGILDSFECQPTIYTTTSGSNTTNLIGTLSNGIGSGTYQMTGDYNLLDNYDFADYGQQVEWNQSTSPNANANITVKPSSGSFLNVIQFSAKGPGYTTPTQNSEKDLAVTWSVGGAGVVSDPNNSITNFNTGDTINSGDTLHLKTDYLNDVHWNVTIPLQHFSDSVVLNVVTVNASASAIVWEGFWFNVGLECDVDNDGIPNNYDDDSDGDGCTDAVEAGHIDLDQDGQVDGIGTDADGKVTGATTAYTGNTAAVQDSTDKQACIVADSITSSIPASPTSSVTVCPTADDIDTTGGTFTSCGAPAGYTQSGPDVNGCYTFTSSASVTTAVTTCVVACDSNGNCDTTYVTIPKPILADSVTVWMTIPTTPLTVCPTADDVDATGGGYSSCGAPTGFSISGPDVNGCFTYTPTAPLTSPVTTCVVACDSNGNCDTTYVTFKSMPLNPSYITTAIPACPTCPITACPIADEINVNGGSYTSCGAPAGYTQSGPDVNGCYTYTPDGTVTTSVTTCVVACDAIGNCDSTYVTIPKPISSDSISVTLTNPTAPITVCPTADDIDTTGGTYTSCGAPTGYSQSGPDVNGCYTLTPNGNVFTIENTCLVACDSNGNCDTTYVTINPSLIIADSITAPTPPCLTCPVTVCPLANNIDTTGGTYSSCGAPAGYSQTGPDTNGCYTYTPNGNVTTPVTTCIIACDSVGNCDTSFVLIPTPENLVAPLSVDFGDFNLTKGDCSVALEWNTLSEQNTLHFLIQRKLGNNDYETIEQVEARGNENLGMSYSYIDENLPTRNQVYYAYRLQIEDINGSISYSPTRSLLVKCSDFSNAIISAYPNPTHGRVFISLKGFNTDNVVELKLYNTIGQLVRQANASVTTSATTMAEMDISALSKGVYMLKATDKNTGDTYQLRLLKE